MATPDLDQRAAAISIRPMPQGADSWDAFPLANSSQGNAPAQSGGADPWAAFPLASTSAGGVGKPAPGYAEDIGLSLPSGLARGVASTVGMVGDAQGLLSHAFDWIEQHARGEGDDDFANRVAERRAKLSQNPPPDLMPTSQGVRSVIEGATGRKLYEPQTTPGKFAGKIAEFVPGAIAGGGASARNLVNFAALPAIADEGTRELTHGTSAESWAPAVAGIATGGVASVLNRPRTVETALRGHMGPQVDRAAVDQAAQVMDNAAQQGVRLTWAEALEQVSPGAGLTNMQRILESTPGSREVLGPMMAERPGQVERAARQTFDTMAPPNHAPSTIGTDVRDAANTGLSEVRQRINDVARPYYDRASTVLMTPAEMRPIRAAPGWQEARDAVRNDPQLNRHVQHLPEDSVGFLNEVKKYLDQTGRNADSRFAQNRNQQRSAGYGQDAATVRGAAVNATLGNPARNYETALNIESQGRQQFLEPLMAGPLGKIAQRDTTTRKAIDALFPVNPLPNSEREITTAVTALAARNQRATRDLLRAYAESTFNEAAKNLQSGPNQFGGAKFAVQIAGNPQQRANLEAAVRASGPDGDRVWQGFNRLLETVEATGTRQPKGSLTAFNAQELKDWSTGGTIANTVKTVSAPAKLLNVLADTWSRWQLGRNVEQLAEVLTDPRSRNILRGIAGRPAGARESQVLAANALMLTNTSLHSGARNDR